MSDAVVESTPQATSASPAVKKSKAKAAGGPKKPKAKPTHPPTTQMINAAIKALKERGGSSLPAIKKWIAANYKVDVGKLAPFIKKSLKTSVAKGELVQTKGKGASGSFKLPAKETKEKVAKKPKAKKVVAKKTTSGEKKAKKPAVKKSTEKKAKASTAKAAKKSGTAKPKQKSTKPKAAAAKKPKTPKPKKVAAKKPAAKKPAKK